MSDKIKIFTISDHPLSPSGVGTQTKYVVEALLNSGNFEVKNILTFFIYLEIMQMVSIFFETGKIPVRYPIYISMIGLARYIILEDLNVNEALAISGSILLLSLALVGLAYRNKLVNAGDNEE